MKHAVLALVALGMSACGVDETGVNPPADALWFPLGVAAHPDGRYLYVSNAVFDRRYNAGTVVVYDTVARRLLPEATVQIGLFAGELALARKAPAADCTGEACRSPLLAYTVTRNDNRLVRMVVDAAAGDGAGHLACDQRGRTCGAAAEFADFGDDGAFSPDPFGLAVDGDGLLLTHVGRGVVSRWDEAPNAGLSYRCALNLTEGATAVARHPATGEGYVTDRFGQRIFVVEKVAPFGEAVSGVAGDPCELRASASITVDPSSERGRTRGLAFSADGTLLYVASSTDSTLRIFDTSVGPDGPRNRLLAAIPTGGTPNLVRVAGLRPGEQRVLDGLDHGAVGTALDAAGGGLVYVTLFDDDAVVVIDPQTLSVRARIDVPGGPHDLAFLPDPAGALRAYVTLFEAHGLAVLDIQPGSDRQFSLLATVP
ncbi:MAG: hypothetical protein H6706_16260 [Myxococcales bacterium]|nr:hypothetical protein [Myxococcales bacterium]